MDYNSSLNCKISSQTMELFVTACQEIGMDEDEACDRAIFHWAKGWEKEKKKMEQSAMKFFDNEKKHTGPEL